MAVPVECDASNRIPSLAHLAKLNGEQGPDPHLEFASNVSLVLIELQKTDLCQTHLCRFGRFTAAIASVSRPILFMLCNWGEFIPALFAPMFANTWRTTYDMHDDYTNMLKTADWNDETHAYAGPSTGWNGKLWETRCSAEQCSLRRNVESW